MHKRDTNSSTTGGSVRGAEVYHNILKWPLVKRQLANI